MLKLHARHASASEAGDYFQVMFEEQADAEGSRYLLIQRQFEFPDEECCAIETEQPDICGQGEGARLFDDGVAFLTPIELLRRFNPWPVRRGGPGHQSASKVKGVRNLGHRINPRTQRTYFRVFLEQSAPKCPHHATPSLPFRSPPPNRAYTSSLW
jgi:hypothetical protein